MKHVFTSRLFVLLELGILTIGIPFAMVTVLSLRALIPLLWITVVYAIALEKWLNPNMLAVSLKWKEHYKPYLRPMLVKLGISCVLVIIMTWGLFPEKLGNFVMQRPLVWLLVMFLYPLLSVIPQEIIFRRFFFWRYSMFFSSDMVMVLASGLTFGLVHIIFQNWVAPILSAIGGIIFARTYQRTNSLLMPVIEHSLYGCMVFTVGLGQFFFHGYVK